MARFSANLSIMFQELPFLDQFAAARQAGFDAVECWFPYDVPVTRMTAVLDDNALAMVGINSASGAAGEWGIAALPGREDDFLASIDQALEYAQAMKCAVHVMAGLAGGIERNAAEAAYIGNLERAVERASGSGVQLLIEPLNSRDRPGYFLSRSDQAATILARSGFETLRMMFDCYHIQIEEGDLITRLRRHFDRIGHIQIAAVPTRFEPDEGEIDFGFVCAEIDRLGWMGWIGAEYRPRGTTLDGLAWRENLLRRIEQSGEI